MCRPGGEVRYCQNRACKTTEQKDVGKHFERFGLISAATLGALESSYKWPRLKREPLPMRAEAAKRLHCTSLDFAGSEAASLLGRKLRGGEMSRITHGLLYNQVI